MICFCLPFSGFSLQFFLSIEKDIEIFTKNSHRNTILFKSNYFCFYNILKQTKLAGEERTSATEFKCGKLSPPFPGFIILKWFVTTIYTFASKACIFCSLYPEMVITGSERRCCLLLHASVTQAHYATAINMIIHKEHNEIKPDLL